MANSIDFDQLVQAIKAQESGGRNVTSVDGAIGPMQITLPTWQTYARAGENIHNPRDNEIVGRRILAHLGELTNWDAHKMAQGYFAGPGGIGKDRADSNNKGTQSYANDIIRRISGGAQERPATFHVRKPDADYV